MASPYASNPTAADRVKETTTATPTLSVGATINLAGAVTQFQSFVAGIGNGHACFYCVLSGNGTDWQVSRGTVVSGSPNTISVDAFLASSTGSPITLSGTSSIFQTHPAHGTDFYTGGAWDATGATSYLKGAIVTFGGLWWLARENVPAPNYNAPPAIDGSASGSASGSSLTVTLTTTQADDVVYLAINGNASASVSGVSSTNTTGWVRRQRVTQGTEWVEIWRGSAAAALTSEAIGITLTGSDYPAGIAIGVSGANYSAPGDTNAAHRVSASGTSSTTPAVTGLSTDEAYDLLLCFIGVGGASGANPSAFTDITHTTSVNPSNIRAGYLSVTTTETNAGWTAAGGAVANWGMVVDAITAGAGPPGVDPRWVATGGLTSAALDAVIGSTQGMLLYRDASAWKALSPGAAGYLLQTGGTAANPSWISGGGVASGLYSQVMSGVAPTQASTGFGTWVNQGSATVTNGTTGVSLYGPSGGNSENWHGLTKTAPTPPYTVKALLAAGLDVQGTTFPNVGIGWTDGTKLHIFSLNFRNYLPFCWVMKYNSVTSYNNADSSISVPIANPIWIWLTNSGTNITFAYAIDGANPTTLFTVAIGSGFLGSGGYGTLFFGIDTFNTGVRGTLMAYSD
jgi:hypothetical protein